MFNDNSSIDFNKQKSEYIKHISNEIIYSARLVTSLGMGMFMLFHIADKYAFSTNHDSLFYIRLGACLLFGLVLFATYQVEFSKKTYSILLPIPYFVASSAVNYMIYLAGPGDYASQVYFVGLLLIIMMMFGWSFLNISISLGISAYILAAYSYIELSAVDKIEQSTLFELFINLSFLLSAALIGFISQLNRDRHLRENYMLQKSLKDAYNKKSEEARDNEYLANHDSLTGLPNRRYMMELLTRSLEMASQKDKILVIMFMDLNGFKQINDVYGHSAGDEVLLIVAKRLELAIRKGDHLSRLGGDEYLLGLTMDKESLGDVEAMASKFADVVGQSMNVEGLRLQVGASIGVAAYPIHGNSLDALINIADHRMYQVKNGKKPKLIDDEEDRSVVIFPGNKKSGI